MNQLARLIVMLKYFMKLTSYEIQLYHTSSEFSFSFG